jgi:hypothetical protein
MCDAVCGMWDVVRCSAKCEGRRVKGEVRRIEVCKRGALDVAHQSRESMRATAAVVLSRGIGRKGRKGRKGNGRGKDGGKGKP